MMRIDCLVGTIGLCAFLGALGCSDEAPGGTSPAPDGIGGETTQGSGGTGSSGGSGGGATAQTPAFSLDSGSCSPNPLPGPEPVYENTDTFAHVDGLVAYGDELLFGESYDFNNPPPRIAKMSADGTVTTLVEGEGRGLTVHGDLLYFVDADGLKTLDLANSSAIPELQTSVSNAMAFSQTHVVFNDETDVFSVEIGLLDDVSSAVNMGPLAELVRGSTISGNSLYYHNIDDVFAMSLDGSGSTQVTPTDNFRYIWLLAVDDTHAFYDDSPLRMVPLAGGDETTLGTAGPGPFGGSATFTDLESTSSVVYWADDDESWGWTAKDGMTCGILGQHDGFFGGAVAVSDSYVYARGDAEIYRVDRVD